MEIAAGTAVRIQSLDVVRGVAVMGILAMNIVAFAMPFQAYMNPVAFGLESAADYWSWLFSFVFVDGKMRGLFSFLFGASTLLVIDRARAAGIGEAGVHYRRMIWLLVFGLIHFYFIWFGDILAGYALTGMILYFFRNRTTRALIVTGIILVAVQCLIFNGLAAGAAAMSQAASQPGADPRLVIEWQALEQQFGILTGQPLSEKLALYRGGWGPLVEHRLIQRGLDPFTSLLMFGWETLAYMLFGMAALRSGFLRGDWNLSLYRRIAIIGLALSVPAYALLAWVLTRDGFTVPMVLGIVMAATTPFRPVMVLAYAALVILLARHGGAMVDRIAAAGRAAFTNYLGTSLLMTGLFYGYGLGRYGMFSRAELWLVVFAMWALMLSWSRPWLDRFRYGPLEWLWRSLARWRLEPMRRP